MPRPPIRRVAVPCVTLLGLALLGLALACWPSAGAAQEAEKPGAAKRFSPEAHFPAPALVYAGVGNVARLDEKLSGTLPGRILSDPGTQRTFAGLIALVQEQVRQGSGPFVQLTGKSPLEVLGLLRGEVAFCLRGISLAGVPEAVLAVELGKDAEDILGVVARLRAAVRGGGGGGGDGRREGDGGAGEGAAEGETASFEGVEANLWPTPAGPFFECVLGTHLVFATSELAWKTTVTNYLGGAGARTAEQPIVPEDALKRLAVQDREALLFVDLAAVREIVLAFGGGSPDGKELRRVLEVSGAGGLTAFGCAVGFRDGGLEGAVHLGLRAGAGGILEAIRSGLPPLGKDAAGALALIPAAAHDVQAATVAPGKLLREIDAALRRGVPEIAGDMDDFYRMVEANVAVSVEQDLFGLGEITFVAFGIDPPAGGLFGDQVVLARTEAVEPYWKVLEKAAEALGAPIEPIEAAGGKVLTCNLAGGKAAEAFRGAIFEGRGFVPSGPEMLILLAAGTGAYVTRADLPGGWTALSALPQAAVRHLESYSKGPRLPADGELASLLKAQLGGASVVGANQGDRTFLYLYNTAVSLLGAFGPLLAVVGVNPAHLPPAERFLADARAGFLRLEAGPEGFTLRGHRWHGSPAVALAAVGAGAMMAGFLVPTLARGRGEALAVQCMNNLKQLYTFSLAYSEDAGGDAFPYSPEGSVAALRLLIEHDEDHQLPAKLFVCPEGGHEAPAVEEGKVALTEETSSYEVVPWRLRSTTANAIFMYDKGPHHRGRRNVLFSDGSIQVLEEGEFQERLAREKEASAKKAAPGKKAPAKKKKARKAPPKEDPEEDE